MSVIRWRSDFFGPAAAPVSASASSTVGTSTFGGATFSPVNSRKPPPEPQKASAS